MNNRIFPISLAIIILSSLALTAYADELPPTLGDLGVTSSGTTATSVDASSTTQPSPTSSGSNFTNAINNANALLENSTTTDTSTPAATTTKKAFQDFTDVPVSDPNYNAIIVLRYQGVLSGYPDNTFHPAQSLNRVEALKLIFSASAQSDTQTGIAPASFADTQTTAWYSGYLNRALFLEVVNGYPDGTFKPERPVNLVEFLKMLEVANKVDLSNVELNQIAYADIMPGQWYTKYVNYAKIHSLLSPDKDNKISPDQPVTRAQAAEILYRFRNLLSQPKTPASSDAGSSSSASASAPLLAKDMALYVSTGYHFALQYPKLWFYATVTNPAANDIRTYGFGPKDLATNAATVTLELLPDSKDFAPNLVYKTYNYLRQENNGLVSLSVKIDGSSRIYKFSGTADQETAMLTMLTSLTANIEGLESYNPAEKPDDGTTTSDTSTTTTTTTPDTTTTSDTTTTTGSGN